jgi:hypothetical protein
MNALPRNNSVNVAQHAAIKEAVFSVDLIDAPIGWLDSDHVICMFTIGLCPFLSHISKAVTSYEK